MNDDRRAANAWAVEWMIRRRNRRIISVIAGILLVAVIGIVIHFITVFSTRTVFRSEEEMRAALQGRFESDYAEDIEIIGDEITLTYYEISHYDKEYAEKYGYSEYDDSVYEDTVEKWDYLNGVIKCRWMSDIKVDKKGRLVYYSQTFEKTDADKPVPFDPSELNAGAFAGDSDGELTEEEEDALEASKDSLDQTEEAAEAFEDSEESEGV